MTNNGKWYIDNILQANVDSYKQQLSSIFNLNSVDELITLVNPNSLIKTFIGNGTSGDSKEGRDELMYIVNSMLPDELRKDSSYLENLFEEINDYEQKIKFLKKDLKEKNYEIEKLKNDNKNILNWDSNIENYNDRSLCEIKSKIDDYYSTKNKTDILYAEINKTEVEIASLRNSNHTSDLNANKKESKFKIIFLSIITLGLYLIFKRKSKTQQNIVDNSYLIREKENILLKKREEYNKLIQNISQIDITDLEYKKKCIMEKIEEDENVREKKEKYSKLLNEKEIIENEIKEIENELNKKKREKNKFSESVDEILNENFSSFDIELFDEKGSEKISITQNGIDLKYLNHANRYNIIYELNEFLKNKNIRTFSLIDQAESFNQISSINNSQVISCKVTKDNNIKVNGKNVN